MSAAFNKMFKKDKRNSVNFSDFSNKDIFKDIDKDSKDSKDSKDTHSLDLYTDQDSQYNPEPSQSKACFGFDRDSNTTQNLYETRYNFQNIKQKNDKPKNVAQKQNTFICEMCNTSSSNSQFIILNCNHIFHIDCLAKIQLTNAKNCQIIDTETFFNKVKCHTCNDPLESSEIMMIHNKFYKGTSDFIKNHNKTIDKLEVQINGLKEEMKTCMEYKQKLEFDQNKSKQILTLLNNMPI